MLGLISTSPAPMPRPAAVQLPRATGVHMNLFGDIFDDGLLKAQKPYPNPLLPKLVKERAASYVLQEKLLSFSGEDFGVRDTEGNTVIQIEGGNINLGGMVIDKVRVCSAALPPVPSRDAGAHRRSNGILSHCTSAGLQGRLGRQVHVGRAPHPGCDDVLRHLQPKG